MKPVHGSDWNLVRAIITGGQVSVSCVCGGERGVQ